jgi:hypothetical protein
MPTIRADVKWKRGLKQNLSTLEPGVPAIADDTKEAFVGTTSGNIQLAKIEDVASVEARFNDLAQVNADVEVLVARGGEKTLGNRLDKVSDNLADIVHNISSYPTLTGETTDSARIQRAIDTVFNLGGGTVKLPKGTYIATGLKIRTHVKLLGDGVATKIKNPSNVTTDVISIYDDNTYGFSIENLQIDGNSGNGCTGDGIHLNRTNGATGAPTSEVYESGDGWFRLENIDIYNCGKDGLYIGNNCREGRYFSISTSWNKRHGLFNEAGSDNHFFAISSYANGQNGILDQGGANHFTNCKSWGNGRTSYGQSTRYAGWKAYGAWATSYISCETQENAGHGFEFINCSNMIGSLTASSNGIGGGASATNPDNQSLASDETMYGVYMKNSNTVQLNVIGEDFRRKQFNANTQKATLFIESDCDLNYAFISEMFQSQPYINNSTTSTVYSTHTKQFDNLNGKNISSPNRITSLGKKVAVTQYDSVEIVLTPTASPYFYTNNNDNPIMVLVQGGTVSQILIAGVSSSDFSNVGMTQGTIIVPPHGSIQIVYTTVPTVKVFQL